MTDKKKKHSERTLEFSCFMPLQFHLLCTLTEVEPRKVLYDFMVNAGMEGYGLGEEHRQKAMEYFLQCGYGQHYYTPEDMRQLFKEMEAISGLFPRNCKPKMQDSHVKWRKEYFVYWFKKWGKKYRRKVQIDKNLYVLIILAQFIP